MSELPGPAYAARITHLDDLHLEAERYRLARQVADQRSGRARGGAWRRLRSLWPARRPSIAD